MSTAPPPISLPSDASPDEVLKSVGELVRVSIQRSGASVIVQRNPQSLTVLPPTILDHVPDEVIAEALLGIWTDDEIVDFLNRRSHARGQDHPSR